MEVKYYDNDNKVHIELEGEIAFNNAGSIKEAILEAIRDTDETVVIGLSKVGFVDSAGLGVFINLLKRVNQQGSHLILEYPQLGVQKLLGMTRLDELIEVRKREEPTTGNWPDARL